MLALPATAAQAAGLLRTMARHAQQGLGYSINLAPPKPKTPDEQQLHLVQALPGVGAAKAVALLERFGSAGGVFQATAAELATVAGLGQKSAGAIRVMLDHPYR